MIKLKATAATLAVLLTFAGFVLLLMKVGMIILPMALATFISGLIIYAIWESFYYYFLRKG